MKKFQLLFLVMVSCLIVLASIPMQAQAVLPTPVAAAPALSPDAMLALILGMAGTVFAAMQILKGLFLNKLYNKFALTDDEVSAANMGAAVLLGCILVFGSQTPVDIFTASRFQNPFSPFLTNLITGFLVGAGNAIIHAAHDFLGGANGTVATGDNTTIIQPGNGSGDVVATGQNTNVITPAPSGTNVPVVPDLLPSVDALAPESVRGSAIYNPKTNAIESVPTLGESISRNGSLSQAKITEVNPQTHAIDGFNPEDFFKRLDAVVDAAVARARSTPTVAAAPSIVPAQPTATVSPPPATPPEPADSGSNG